MTESGGRSRDQDLDDVLSVIARQARASNQARAVVIADVLAQVPEVSADQVEQAVRSAHQLAGSAGTFGMTDASRLARRLEAFLAAGEFSNDGELAAAHEDLTALQRALADN